MWVEKLILENVRCFEKATLKFSEKGQGSQMGSLPFLSQGGERSKVIIHQATRWTVRKITIWTHLVVIKALSENNIALAGLLFSDKAWKLFMDNF